VLALTPPVADACLAASPEVSPELARAVVESLLPPPGGVPEPQHWVRASTNEYLALLALLDDWEKPDPGG